MDTDRISLTEYRLAAQPRPNKYGAKKVRLESGEVFDSQMEYRRWQALQLLESAGAITNLRRQVEYRLIVNGVLIGKLTVDHVYSENGKEIVEDVKGSPSRDWILRKKLMLACYGIAVQEWPGRKNKRKARKAA